ncbi:MAG: TAXI family TRAP transporter solute-binding subunit [Betaproteobacteria bacterium]
MNKGDHAMLDRRRLLQGAALLSIAPLSSLGAQERRTLSIVTGGTGGVYYPLGGGLANMLAKHVPGWQATSEVTGGSVDNLKLLGARKADIGFTMADASLDAAKGEDKFKGAPVPNRALAVLYPNRMHVVTVDGTNITKFSDLKGKRVSTGSPGSATEVMAFRLIEAAGMDKDKDMKRERLGVAESVNAIKDRKIDAFFWVGGLPTGAVTDLANSPGMKIKMIDHEDLIAAMNKKYGNLYYADVIAKSVYQGMAADNKMASVANLLVAPGKMTNEQAYAIVKTIVERREDLIAVHKEAANIKLENQKSSASPVPYHPGARKYLEEKGIKLD